MIRRAPPLLPHKVLRTEEVRVAVPLSVKQALAATARRRGKTMSGLVREAIEGAVTDGTGKPKGGR